jgi:hypothetical protein
MKPLIVRDKYQLDLRLGGSYGEVYLGKSMSHNIHHFGARDSARGSVHEVSNVISVAWNMNIRISY